MRKRIINLSLMVALSLSFSLCGCGKEEVKDTTTATAATEATTSDATSSDAERVFSIDDYNNMLDRYSAFCTLNEYKGIEYEAFSTEVTDDMVTSSVDAFLDSVSTEKKIMEGTTKEGDTVNIDYVGSIDDVNFEGGTSNDQGYNLTLGSGTFIPGMEEQIMNHEVGENFDIKVTFPEEYFKEELAGKDATFNITINYIVEKEKPEYTDALVASYTDASTIADYEASIKQKLSDSLESQAESTDKTTVMDLAFENSTVDTYPDDEIESLINDVIKSYQESATAYNMTFEELINQFYGMDSVDAFKDYLRDAAKGYMKQKIVVCAIAKAENITMTAEDITAYEERLMTSSGIDRATLESAYTMDDVMYYALSEKVNDFLFENAVAK